MAQFRAKTLDIGCFVNARVIRDHTKRCADFPSPLFNGDPLLTRRSGKYLSNTKVRGKVLRIPNRARGFTDPILSLVIIGGRYAKSSRPPSDKPYATSSATPHYLNEPERRRNYSFHRCIATLGLHR